MAMSLKQPLVIDAPTEPNESVFESMSPQQQITSEQI